MFWHPEPPHTGCLASSRDKCLGVINKDDATTRPTRIPSVTLDTLLATWTDPESCRATHSSTFLRIRHREPVAIARPSCSPSFQFPPTVPSLLPLPPRNRERSIDEVSRCFSPRTSEHTQKKKNSIKHSYQINTNIFYLTIIVS